LFITDKDAENLRREKRAKRTNLILGWIERAASEAASIKPSALNAHLADREVAFDVVHEYSNCVYEGFVEDEGTATGSSDPLLRVIGGFVEELHSVRSTSDKKTGEEHCCDGEPEPLPPELRQLSCLDRRGSGQVHHLDLGLDKDHEHYYEVDVAKG